MRLHVCIEVSWLLWWPVDRSPSRSLVPKTWVDTRASSQGYLSCIHWAQLLRSASRQGTHSVDPRIGLWPKPPVCVAMKGMHCHIGINERIGLRTPRHVASASHRPLDTAAEVVNQRMQRDAAPNSMPSQSSTAAAGAPSSASLHPSASGDSSGRKGPSRGASSLYAPAGPLAPLPAVPVDLDLWACLLQAGARQVRL